MEEYKQMKADEELLKGKEAFWDSKNHESRVDVLQEEIQNMKDEIRRLLAQASYPGGTDEFKERITKEISNKKSEINTAEAELSRLRSIDRPS